MFWAFCILNDRHKTMHSFIPVDNTLEELYIHKITYEVWGTKDFGVHVPVFKFFTVFDEAMFW